MLSNTFRMVAALLVTATIAPLAAHASPISYDFYVVTDGKLGGWSFKNALVHFHVRSDTKFVREFQVGFSDILINTYGTFTVKIVSGGTVRNATFAKGLLYTSIDKTGGGVGIGSYDSSGGFLPAYPIGIQDGIPDCIIGDGDCLTPSPALNQLTPDLISSTTMSGRAWSDICFASFNCTPASPPLQTDRGDFVIHGPYTVAKDASLLNPDGDPLVTGMFRAILGNGN
jgi:hypothetical protein